MQSRVKICLLTVDAAADIAGHPRPLGTASSDPNFQHTDAHAPPETMWNPATNELLLLPPHSRYDCFYFTAIAAGQAHSRRP